MTLGHTPQMEYFSMISNKLLLGYWSIGTVGQKLITGFCNSNEIISLSGRYPNRNVAHSGCTPFQYCFVLWRYRRGYSRWKGIICKKVPKWWFQRYVMTSLTQRFLAKENLVQTGNIHVCLIGVKTITLRQDGVVDIKTITFFLIPFSIRNYFFSRSKIIAKSAILLAKIQID